ncbi:M16 family metallopeptidase [Arhodomonas sp. AD133]|uniref:M16 family metallopeptidase n=1 Tax=Arhodomonas sp. AD133 TaxID=3415009 RepID=UPI003EBAF719
MRRLLIAAVLVALIVPSAAMAVPDVQHWQTEGGTRVAFVPARELPIVDVRVVFDAGAARDGDSPGLAGLTNNLLLEGTDAASAGEIARRFEQVGARVSTGSARDMAWVHLRSLSRGENLDAAVGHLAGVLAAPAFEQTAFERVREQMQVSLRYAKQDPGDRAGRAFMRALFGDHPYASPPAGTREGLAAIERADVRAFHERYYGAANATIAIVGDLDRDRAEALARELASARPAGEAAPALPPTPELDSSRTVRVPFDSTQTHVIIGQPAVARGDERWVPLYLANHALGGGGMVSILTERMRDERGLSYNSSSGLSAAAAGGWFQMDTEVRNSALDEALTVLRETLQQFHDKAPAPERLELARRNITGSFPLNFDSNRDLVSYIAMIAFYDLPPDYLQRFRDDIGAVSAERVGDVFGAVIDPGRQITVLVGPAEIIGAGGSDGGDS